MVRTAGVGSSMVGTSLLRARVFLEAGGGLFDVQDQRGVGQAEEFGEDDAGLAEAEIFRLQAGEDEVGVFLF